MLDENTRTERLHVRKDKTNPRRLAYLTLLLFAIPPDWRLFSVGLVLVAAGVALHGWAAGYLARAGYAEREKLLTVRGPYRFNRNPYYVAQMTMDLGFFILAGRPLLYLLYFPLIFWIYQRWVANEEKFLEEEFGREYLILKREVPRWSFRLTPAPARGSELTFHWAIFTLNRELPRTVSHLCFMLAFVTYFFFGNPLDQVTLLARFTVLAAISVWFVLRDIYPVDVSQRSVGWILVAFSSAAVTTMFLADQSVWQPWFGIGAWISIGVGSCFGFLLSTTAFPGRRMSDKTVGKLFPRPICQWYALGLGLGLLSCTFGGVWLGIMVPLTVLALQIAGIMSVKMVPQRLTMSFGLLALFACLSTLAIMRQLNQPSFVISV